MPQVNEFSWSLSFMVIWFVLFSFVFLVSSFPSSSKLSSFWMKKYDFNFLLTF